MNTGLQFPLGNSGPTHPVVRCLPTGAHIIVTIDSAQEHVTYNLFFTYCSTKIQILFLIQYKIEKSYCNEHNRCLTQSTNHRMGHQVIIQDNLATPHLSYIFNNEPYPTPFDSVPVRPVNKLSNKCPFQLMHSPNQHRIPVFKLNGLDLSQQTVRSIQSNTPLIQALLTDGSQFKIHNAWLVTLKIDIVQTTGQTASLALTPLQDTQQKNNQVTYNCTL